MYWDNLKVAQRKELTFYQTRSNAMILHSTLPASCIEIVVAMNSEVVLYNKVHESPCSPVKVALRTAWSEGRQDTTNTEGRKSSAISGKDRETCCRSDEGDTLPQIDCRIQGLFHSTVEQENCTRKEVVNKLIRQFETHPDRDVLKADLKQK